MKKNIQKKVLIGTSILIIIGVISGLYIMWEDSIIVPCNKLPTIDEVNTVLAQHQDVKKQVEEIFYTIGADTLRCPGKADLIISYGTVFDRAKIRNLIGNSFFGIPYRMSNN